MQPLSDSLSAEYRFLVGIAMYMAQERFDIQCATKTLASSLKNPTWKAWLSLGRLIGYLRYTESFALRMEKCEKGQSFMETVLGVDTQRSRNNLEVYTDSDWAGAGDMKSTSAAIHTLNGLVIFSTSRSQKCISLSSTEAEWYSASSGVCDALYLHHIVSFITDDDVDPLTLHVDNSAVKMLSLKQGAGRLRHIKGRLLWLQSKVASHELRIKQVKTIFNVSDVNTKPLQKDRFLGLLFLLGFTSDGNEVGADEFARLQSKELMKNQIQVVSRALTDETGMDETYQRKQAGVNALAKQVLRVLSVFSLVNMTEGLQVSSSAFSFEFCGDVYMSPISVAMSFAWMISWMCQMKFALAVMLLFSCINVAAGSGEGTSSQALSLGLSPMVYMCVFIGVICFAVSRVARHFEGNSDSDESETLLQEPDAETEPNEEQTFNGVKFHVFLAACNERSLQLQSSENNEIAEQAETIYEVIMDCFYSSEDDGVKQSTIDSAMFAYERLQNLDPAFVVDFSALEIENFNTGILAEPDVEDMLPPDMDDEYMRIELPNPYEQYSPEDMGLWMISRLSKRIKQCVGAGDTERCRRNAERRAIMASVLKVCRRDPSQRHRAMFMMQTMDDISPGQSESEGENTESTNS